MTVNRFQIVCGIDAVFKQYPYDWTPFRDFERSILSIGVELTICLVYV